MRFDLVRDYTAALDALPELHEEHERKRKRIAVRQQYGRDLIAYARARGQSVLLPAPPDTREAQASMRQAEAASQARCREADQAVTAQIRSMEAASQARCRENVEPPRSPRVQVLTRFAQHCRLLSVYAKAMTQSVLHPGRTDTRNAQASVRPAEASSPELDPPTVEWSRRARL